MSDVVIIDTGDTADIVEVEVGTSVVEITTGGVSDVVVGVAGATDVVEVEGDTSTVEITTGGQPGPPGPQGPPGEPGSGASTFVSGYGPPTAEMGSDGSVYLDIDSGQFYGPKVDGVWPDSAFGRLLLAANTYADVLLGNTYAEVVTMYDHYMALYASWQN